MEKISKLQFAMLIIMFQIGSSPLFLLGSKAGVDAWIAVLTAMVAGLLLLMLTLSIQRLEPEMELIEIMKTYFGKYLGYMFSVAYFIYFSYKSVRNIREFGDLINTYLLVTTPLWVVIGCVVLTSVYAVWLGIEVFSRVTQIIVPGIALIYLSLFILAFGNGLIDLHRLEPVLGNGYKRVIATAIPDLISFPFGEMVLFLMFWKFVTSKKKLFRTTVYCYLGTGLFLVLTNMFIIAGLGKASQMSLVPFIQVVSLIQYASFIERLDPIVAMLLFTGLYIKMTAYFFGATFVAKHLFKVDQRYIIVVVGGVLFTGALLFRSYMQQIWFGFERNLKYHFPIFQLYIPALLLIVMLVRRRMRTNGSGQS